MITLICIAVGGLLLGYAAGSRDARHARVKWHDPRLGSIGETAVSPECVERLGACSGYTLILR